MPRKNTGLVTRCCAFFVHKDGVVKSDPRSSRNGRENLHGALEAHVRCLFLPDEGAGHDCARVDQRVVRPLVLAEEQVVEGNPAWLLPDELVDVIGPGDEGVLSSNRCSILQIHPIFLTFRQKYGRGVCVSRVSAKCYTDNWDGGA